MIEQVLRLRAGDRLPGFFAQVVDERNEPVDLTGMRAWLIVRALTADNVFGNPSPYVVECSIVDHAQGTVRYDWLQSEVDEADAGRYGVAVRFTDITTGADLFEVPDGRTSTLIISSRVDGYHYLQNADGDLILSAAGQAIEV